MKREYVSPEMEKIIFEVTDIITHSLAGGEGDEFIDFGDTSGNSKPNKKNKSIVFNGTDVYVFGIKG